MKDLPEMFDSLTGLLNHDSIMQQLEAEIPRVHQNNVQLSFILLSIDHFKNIIETHGQAAGEEVLRALGKILLTCLRSNDDLAGRYGEGEFAVLLPLTSGDEAVKFSRRIRERLAAITFEAGDTKFNVTLSAGIATDADFDMLDAALKALHLAMAEGDCEVLFRTVNQNTR